MTMLSIGSDFEWMLKKGNEFFSVEGLIGGTKSKPKWYDDGNLQEDNVLAEAAILPCYNKDEFIARMQAMNGLLYSMAEQHNVKIATNACADYPEQYLSTKQAQEFGCDKDFNAYTEMEQPSPDSNVNFRSAGGHVHVGVEDTNPMLLLRLAKAMDAYIAVPLMLIMGREQKEEEIKRRTLYGQAGSFRLKEYGIEYRTLSNYWTFHEDLIAFVYEATKRAVDFAFHTNQDIDSSKTVGVINDGDTPDLSYFMSLPGWEEVNG